MIQHSSDGTSYSLSGEGEHTLVLIHGVGMNQQVWQPQVDYFAPMYHVLRYDMLGHGDSRQPDEYVTLDEYIDQLQRLLNELGIDQAIVMGHSMGALVAVAFALKYAERVDALIALNIVYRRTPAKRKAVVGRAQEVLVQQKITGIERTLARWFSDKQDAESLQRIEFIKEWLTKVDPLGYGRTYHLFATSDDAFIGRLHQLRMPVLYLTGDKDPNSTPQMSMMMAQETPNGLAEAVANEAHMMAYISPEKINPIVDRFLGDFRIR